MRLNINDVNNIKELKKALENIVSEKYSNYAL